MKILHTADWHIGKKLEYYSRIEEQREVLEEICEIADNEKADAVVIAGDLFDTYNPSTESIELFYRTLKKLANQGARPVIAISGNHDSPERVETADPLARECGIIFIGYPNTHLAPFSLESGLEVLQSESGFIELKIPGLSYPMRIITTPYANEHRLKQAMQHNDKEEELREVLQEMWGRLAEKYCDHKGVNLLATHLFVIPKDTTPPEEPDDEKPILHVGGAQAIYTENFPEQVQYVALGHLHRKQMINSSHHPVVYSGSPLPYSFAEANQQKYVSIIDVKPDCEARVSFLPLQKGKKLIRLFAQGMNEALQLLELNKENLIELTIETDEYLTAKDRRTLSQTHPGIITLIPQSKQKDESTGIKKTIDLNKNMKELFLDYFKHTKGTTPDENLMNLFHEIIAEKDTEA